MRVTVLAGGPDSERDVSLASGRAVAAALTEAGHAVHFADAGPHDLRALDRPCDVIFPAMHGPWGEGGPLQSQLETRGIAYVGSSASASRLGMDKAATKRAWQAAGLPTAPFRIVSRSGLQRVPGSCVVKPVSGGSSIDCFLRPAGPDGQADVAGPIEYLLARYGRCMVEQLVEGLELTVGVLFGRALPTIWIDPTGTGAGWFDYAAKYNTGDDAAAHRFDLPPSLDVGAIEGLCLAAHEAVGCRHLSRVDLIVGASGQVSLLEINTMPGFTGRSLVPDAARRAGIGFVELCDGLVRRAFADAGEVEHEVAA